ncbi:hypothetical protein BBF93_18395 [Hyphomonas sp. CACIAM 19H1]|nr:hypothetical protein BBF93_18395 [Hyphomonas sp. CACIAM 19H1]
MDMVRALALSPGWELSSIHDKDVNGAGQSDVHWITAFSKSGGVAILSADTDFQKQPPQVTAIFNTGLKVIHLPARWCSAPRHLQAAHILMWWKRIERQVEAMKERECYRPQWNVNEEGELTKISLDFANAQRKLKKAARRSGE